MEHGDLTGATLDGRYRVIEAVAEGAMGVVYRAERLKLGRIVAVKVLHDTLPNELSARKRFDIEATAMAKLEHPHVAQVLDVGVHNERPFVVMEFVGGENLKQVLGGGPLAQDRAVEIVRQVLSGLAHAHEHGIIHRDIKPANLVLSQKTGLGDHVKILDFGLARLHDTGQNLTTGITVGTPAYMAPEQVRGQALDHRVDLYACGVLLFELLTGDKPFHSDRDDPIEVCRMHLSAPIPRLDAVRPGVAFGALEGVIVKALAKSADDRYASAADFAAALDAVAPRRASRPLAPLAPLAGPDASVMELRSADLEPAHDATFLGIAVKPAPRAADATTNLDGELGAVADDTSADAKRADASADAKRADAKRADANAGAKRADAKRADAKGAGASADADAKRADASADAKRAAANARPARSHRRGLVIGAALTSAIALVVIVVELTRGAAPAVPDAGVASAAPAPATEVVARVNQLAAQGDRDAALDAVLRGRRQYPDSAALAFTAGRIYFARFYWSDGLRSFRDAIRLDPTFRTDPELIKTVLRGFITTPSYNEDLANFLRDDIGGAAEGFLAETARDHPSPSIRSRAASELKRYR